MKELIGKPAEWLSGENEESELVLSSRVRLARNIDKLPFTHTGREKVMADICGTLKETLSSVRSMKGALVIEMDETSEPDRMMLAERHLITLDVVKNYRDRALVVRPNEKLSVMINEEDHIRLQAIESGLSIRQAFTSVDRLDNELDRQLTYAFSENLGYLTACPTNVGTGLRVSAMIHLPGLVHNKDIAQVLDGLRNVRLTVRGIYGEGTEVMGNLFQVSNSVTLGLSEADTVKNIETHIRKVLEFEKKAREVLLKKARSLLEDKIWRAYGILKSARLVGSKEAMGLISAVRMGIGLGIITDVPMAVMNEILIMIQPMHLQALYNKPMIPSERDRVRADYIRSRLGK
ncbi:MAG: protein arginine kinase [bacterium]|nr:MAG: protein arginine kinase [bacterium]